MEQSQKTRSPHFSKQIARDIISDTEGATAVFMALALAVVMGFLALGLESFTGMHAKHRLQDAVDNAAIGAMLAYRAAPDSAPVSMAEMLLVRNGVRVSDTTSIDIAWPPASGAHAGDPAAIHVHVETARRLRLAAFLGGGSSGRIAAAATAILAKEEEGCVLALDESGDSVRVTHPADLQLDGCSVLSVGNGHAPTRLSDANPWRDVALPGLEGCNALLTTISNSRTIAAGTRPFGFCGGLRVRNGGDLTLGPGVYVLLGALQVDAGASIHGSGVTLILLPGSSANIDPGARVTLKAPLSGSTAGLVLAAGPLTTGSSDLLGGADQVLEGAVYLPSQRLEIAGAGMTPCLHFIADTIRITGPTRAANACTATRVRPIIDRVARLVD